MVGQTSNRSYLHLGQNWAIRFSWWYRSQYLHAGCWQHYPFQQVCHNSLHSWSALFRKYSCASPQPKNSQLDCFKVPLLWGKIFAPCSCCAGRIPQLGLLVPCGGVSSHEDASHHIPQGLWRQNSKRLVLGPLLGGCAQIRQGNRYLQHDPMWGLPAKSMPVGLQDKLNHDDQNRCQILFPYGCKNLRFPSLRPLHPVPWQSCYCWNYQIRTSSAEWSQISCHSGTRFLQMEDGNRSRIVDSGQSSQQNWRAQSWRIGFQKGCPHD